jgi:hypothetical protein
MTRQQLVLAGQQLSLKSLQHQASSTHRWRRHQHPPTRNCTAPTCMSAPSALLPACRTVLPGGQPHPSTSQHRGTATTNKQSRLSGKEAPSWHSGRPPEGPTNSQSAAKQSTQAAQPGFLRTVSSLLLPLLLLCPAPVSCLCPQCAINQAMQRPQWSSYDYHVLEKLYTGYASKGETSALSCCVC